MSDSDVGLITLPFKNCCSCIDSGTTSWISSFNIHLKKYCASPKGQMLFWILGRKMNQTWFLFSNHTHLEGKFKETISQWNQHCHHLDPLLRLGKGGCVCTMGKEGWVGFSRLRREEGRQWWIQGSSSILALVVYNKVNVQFQTSTLDFFLSYNIIS